MTFHFKFEMSVKSETKTKKKYIINKIKYLFLNIVYIKNINFILNIVVFLKS